MRHLGLLLTTACLLTTKSYADLVVTEDLGTLDIGTTYTISGDTATGANNADSYGDRLIDTWENELVFQFTLTSPATIEIESVAITGDPDVLLLSSLVTEISGGLNRTPGLLSIALLDGPPPETETFIPLTRGTYYISVDNFASREDIDSTFTYNLNLSSPVNIGSIATGNTPFTIDTLNSDFDTELAIWDVDGNPIAENDNLEGGGQQSQITSMGLPSGTYHATVVGNSSNFLSGFVITGAANENGNFVFNYGTGTQTGSLAQGEVAVFTFEIAPAIPPVADGTTLILDGSDLFLTTRFPYQANSVLSLQTSTDLTNWRTPGTNNTPNFTIERSYTDPDFWNIRSLLPVGSHPKTFLRASVNAQSSGPATFTDFDGDGRTDWALTRQNENDILWDIPLQSGGTKRVTFGNIDTDTIVSADFDGDGITDIAVWTANVGFNFIQSSDGTLQTLAFDTSDIIGNITPAPADYDGDGIADPALFVTTDVASPASIQYIGSAGSGALTTITWGNGTSETLTPVIGDFDGDGEADYCYRTSGDDAEGIFTLLRSSNNQIISTTWGQANDSIVPGDYDGDGRSDFAVSRSVNGVQEWHILEQDGDVTGTAPIILGLAGDTLVPGDYDGDGRTDPAVWDGSTFTYLSSSEGSIVTFTHGTVGDLPVANSQVE